MTQVISTIDSENSSLNYSRELAYKIFDLRSTLLRVAVEVSTG